MNVHSIVGAAVLTVLASAVAMGQSASDDWAKPPELVAKETELQEKWLTLIDHKLWLRRLKERKTKIEELEKAHKDYKKKLQPLLDDLTSKYNTYMERIKLRNSGLFWKEYTRELERHGESPRDRRDVESLGMSDWSWWWDTRHRGMYSDTLVREDDPETRDVDESEAGDEGKLNKARNDYWKARDVIDQRVFANHNLYLPRVEIRDLDTLGQVVKRHRLQFDKISADRIRDLEGTRGAPGVIDKLKAEIDELQAFVDEWNATRRRPGTTVPIPPAPPQPVPPAPEPAPPVVERGQPDLVSQIVEVTPSGPIGNAPNRRCVWQFYIKLEERGARGVELLFVNAAIEPSRQDDDAKRYHHTPSHRYSWRPEEVDQLGGATAPNTLAVGPFFLMVWEDEGFVGRYEATFAATERDGSGVSTTVSFTPPQPPWMAMSALKVIGPDADALIGPAGCPESGFGPHDRYHLGFGVYAPDLPPGLHRLKLAFDPGPSRYIWARVPQGKTGVQFHDRIPIPLGRYTVTLSVPESPQIAPLTLNGRCDPARGTVEYLNKAVAKFNSGSFETARQRGDGLVDVADRQNSAGLWADALNTATQAVSLLPEYSDGASGTSWTVGENAGRYYRNRAVQAQATAVYHLGDTEKFLALMRWLWEYEARLGEMPRLKSCYCDAGGHAHFAAKRLLRMGAHPDQVKQLIDLGNQYYRQGGNQHPPRTEWFPK